MRVLGVDPGLGRCGWAVLEGRGGRARAIGYGTVHTEGAEVAPRLAELATKLRQVLAAHRPEALAIERLFFNANVRTAMTVGQASGVVLLLAAEHGLEVTAYTPPQVKQAVTGSGNAPKEQVGYMVKALLGLASVPTPADTADALAVALCHLNHAGLGGLGAGGGVARNGGPDQALGAGTTRDGAAEAGGAEGSAATAGTATAGTAKAAGVGAAPVADWLARAAPTSPGLRSSPSRGARR